MASSSKKTPNSTPAPSKPNATQAIANNTNATLAPSLDLINAKAQYDQLLAANNPIVSKAQTALTDATQTQGQSQYDTTLAEQQAAQQNLAYQQQQSAAQQNLLTNPSTGTFAQEALRNAQNLAQSNYYTTGNAVSSGTYNTGAYQHDMGINAYNNYLAGLALHTSKQQNLLGYQSQLQNYAYQGKQQGFQSQNLAAENTLRLAQNQYTNTTQPLSQQQSAAASVLAPYNDLATGAADITNQYAGLGGINNSSSTAPST